MPGVVSVTQPSLTTLLQASPASQVLPVFAHHAKTFIGTFPQAQWQAPVLASGVTPLNNLGQ